MRVKLKHVRLSYPHLFTPKAGPDGGDPKYSAAFILDKEKDKAQIKELKAAIAKVHAESPIAKTKIPDDKICLKDGSSKPDTYEDTVMFINASRGMKQGAPPVVNKNPKQALTEADDIVYGGCYVNAVVDLWVQNNKWGKRINATLETVQFSGEGERFGRAPVKPEDEFEDIEEEDDPRA